MSNLKETFLQKIYSLGRNQNEHIFLGFFLGECFCEILGSSHNDLKIANLNLWKM